jgi:uncharacterized integral membrane protein
MPWRMILFLIVLGLIVLFAALNTSNASSVSFGFVVFEDVPVFLSLFIAFLVGAFVMLPFTIKPRRSKRNKENKRAPEQEQPGDQPQQLITNEQPKKRKSRKERKAEARAAKERARAQEASAQAPTEGGRGEPPQAG